MGCYRNAEDKRYVHDRHAYEYDEDERLSTAMKSLNVYYTAQARGRACNSMVLLKMPEGTPLTFFYFMDHQIL